MVVNSQALVTVRAVQWSQPHVRQRFMLAESADTLYCALESRRNPDPMRAQVRFVS